jgi:hypothetical protein
MKDNLNSRNHLIKNNLRYRLNTLDLPVGSTNIFSSFRYILHIDCNIIKSYHCIYTNLILKMNYFNNLNKNRIYLYKIRKEHYKICNYYMIYMIQAGIHRHIDFQNVISFLHINSINNIRILNNLDYI